MAFTRTRRRLLAAGLIAVIAATFAGWWAYDPFALNAAERNLVGTWSQTRDDGGIPDGILAELTLREDRTLRLIHWDAKTGAVVVAIEEDDWWGISDGVLTLRQRPEKPPARPWFAWWDWPRPDESYDELRLILDGPDRIRYTVLRADQLNTPLSDPRPTGTWTRIDSGK